MDSIDPLPSHQSHRDRLVYDRYWSSGEHYEPSQTFAEMLDRLQAERSRVRVADLGCGIGRHALYAAARGASGVFHGMREEDLQVFLAHPLTMIASDAGPKKFGESVPHPRGYGNNARVLGHYVRELKVITLEDAVRKMTSLPAQTFHLGNRGVLKAGYVADVVIFDPAAVNDPSTYGDPHHYATGFSDVIVNGVPIIRAGELTGALPGKPVRLTPPAPN